MQERFRPGENDPYSRITEGFRPVHDWSELSLPEELGTPEKRFAATLNTLANGAQALTVITMRANQTYAGQGTINRHLRETLGAPLVSKESTKHHLKGALLTNGVVTQSTLQDTEWALTEFGVALRPALIYGMDHLSQLGFDAMDVLGTRTGFKQEGQPIPQTPPLTRATILMALHPEGHLREADFMQLTGLTNTSIKHHLTALSGTPETAPNQPQRRLIHYEAKTTEYDKPLTYYTVQAEQLDHMDAWPTHEILRSDKTISHDILGTETVKKAIQELCTEGTPLTLPDLSRWILERTQNPALAKKTRIAIVINNWVKAGIMERGEYSSFIKSSAELTPLGKQVVDDLLVPLRNWTEDPESVPGIVEIAEGLKNGQTYINVLRDTARSFAERSPNKTQGIATKTDTVLSYVRKFSGGITRADLAKLMGVSDKSVGSYVEQLISNNEITEIEPEHGKKKYLSITPSDSEKN